MGSWGFYDWPTEPPTRDDSYYDWLDDEREAEWEARPTYDELMEQYDNEVEEEG